MTRRTLLAICSIATLTFGMAAAPGAAAGPALVDCKEAYGEDYVGTGIPSAHACATGCSDEPTNNAGVVVNNAASFCAHRRDNCADAYGPGYQGRAFGLVDACWSTSACPPGQGGLSVNGEHGGCVPSCNFTLSCVDPGDLDPDACPAGSAGVAWGEEPYCAGDACPKEGEHVGVLLGDTYVCASTTDCSEDPVGVDVNGEFRLCGPTFCSEVYGEGYVGTGFYPVMACVRECPPGQGLYAVNDVIECASVTD